ncbi:GspD1 [Desulfamplus magnetovallimortis]|uniref:GspD1 n=1 Tax=Desulfamplus magnetovallimortis TaxID=1246637 RepID=A0A1W1HLL4_9BACT|nr:type II secretion system secretin GspD [Desulfamplus magnetovallimortis]SLM33228.1 GspD1 [Desulfamplus magnetovallimortis]
MLNKKKLFPTTIQRIFITILFVSMAFFMTAGILPSGLSDDHGLVTTANALELKKSRKNMTADGHIKQSTQNTKETTENTKETEIIPNINEADVSIDFNNVDINVFIKFISELTKKNFIVDNRVKGNVTVISPSRISVKEAYRVFESVLNIHGFSAVESGEVIKIMPLAEARSQNLDTRLFRDMENSGDSMVTRIIPLTYADADEMKRIFTPLISKGSVILSYSDTNMLIITDTQSNIERLMKIIDAVDIMGIGKKISVIPVQNADAVKLVQNLSTIFTARSRGEKGKEDPDLTVKFVADERTNSVVLLASEAETERVTALINLLDQKIPKGEEKVRVYYLEHASSENLAKVLQEIPSAPADGQAQGKKLAPIVSKSVRIMADKATNSLIIMADKEDYPVLEEVISKLDIPRAMVYIECLIMEVNVTSGLDIGTEWRVGEGFDSDDSGNDRGVYFGGFGGNGYSNFNTIATTGNLPTGFSVGVMGKTLAIGNLVFPSIGAVVQAYKSDDNVHILSTPQILTTDNEEASLTIGKNVPYQTRSAADNATDTYSSYEYKDVGITLKITPQISNDRLVRLNVFQEITKLDSVTQSAQTDRPTTLKRQIQTTLIVEDGNTVVIGGLIDETLSKSQHSLPCLGDIPGLGYLFKTVSDGEDRTNLYVFLTPRVIKNPLEAEGIYNEKKEEIDSIKKGSIKLYKGN